ncbi:uncharacterized protein LOC124924848 [Impatiens glandulifera]|uniref:uncharacterized protein LOC124924848 n=1 Tax=Impatiens glandulifera TaxID=253017 RepID=UPI001FB0786F|nr:uncharacterized protein LOC124924848 [Impatiens glandulifera]
MVRCYLILCVFLLLLASPLPSEANRKVLETLADAVELAVDQVLIGCSKENITKEEDTHCESCLSSKILLVKKRKPKESILDLPPQAKRTLLDCLRKHHSLHSRTWFSKFRPIVSKTYIVCNTHASKLFRARRLGDSKSAPNPTESDGHHARAPAHQPRRKKRDSQKHVAIVSTITAVAVIILSPIVYLCCLRGDSSKANTRNRQRDRQSRLNACSYEISAGILLKENKNNSISVHYVSL